MIDFYGSTYRDQIEQTLAVCGYALCIAENEHFSEADKTASIYAALLHDTGIKIGKDRKGSCTQKEQEEYGPAAARDILSSLDIDAKTVDRICWLIGHHHTPELVTENSGNDFQALIEADFLANLVSEAAQSPSSSKVQMKGFDEGFYPDSSFKKIEDGFFRTETGKHLIETMFEKEDIFGRGVK
jgi:hypothetical protein